MQRARAFFYVAAGLFLLAASYHLGARSAGAQAQVGSSQQEIAILTGTLNDGQTIPLPTYGDGTEAVETDCKWFVSLRDFPVGTVNVLVAHCSAENRVVSAYVCVPDPHNCVPTDPTFTQCSVNYLIIATRVTAPVSTTPSTLGQLKARFRDPAQPQGNR